MSASKPSLLSCKGGEAWLVLIYWKMVRDGSSSADLSCKNRSLL